MGSLPAPPKLVGLDTGQGPQSVADWLSIYRFLIQLWRKADNATTDQQVQTFISQQASGASLDDATGASLAFSQPPRQIMLSVESMLATAVAIQPPQVAPAPNNGIESLVHMRSPLAAAQSNGMDALALAAFVRPPYPSIASGSTPPASLYGSLVEGVHDDRISAGTGTVAGTTLTRVTGPSFRTNWVGKQIAINGGLYTITTWTNANNVVVAGGPPAGAVGWEFMLYPANSVPAQSAFMETDHHVIYRTGDSFGTANINHFTLTWVSGPLFSPYWGGLTITIAGTPYIVSFSNQTTLTLTTDSGVVTAGVTWGVVSSSWFYETGIETLSLAQFAARTFDVTDDNYIAFIYDYGHSIIYNGFGAAWGWGPGDAGSKWLAASGDGSAPQGGPWHFCDGSVASVFEIVAGVPQAVNVTTENLTGDTFLRGGAFTGSADPTSSPTFTAGSLVNSAESVNHTHSMPGTVTGNESAAHTHTNASTANAQPYASGTAVVVPLTLNTESALHTHTSLVNNTGIESATHTHTITGTGAVGAPTVGSGAPKSFALLWYLRV